MIIINTDIENLIETLKKIKMRGWIDMTRAGYGENGLFLESLLNIKHNDLPIPDYNDIELKVQSKYSEYPITLFSLDLNGPEPMELQRLVARYGAYDSMYPNSKILYIRLNHKEYTKWGKSLKMKLHYNKYEKKLYIHVSHKNGKTIEIKSFWYINSILSTMQKKLSNLCIVECQTKTNTFSKYIYYSNFKLYKLLSHDNFIKALLDGKIFVHIKYGIYKSGPKAGLPYNHGISFQVYFKDLNNIFEEVLLQKK